MTAPTRNRGGRPKGSPNIAHRDLAVRVAALMTERGIAMLPALAIVAHDEQAPVMHRLLSAQQIGLHGIVYIMRQIATKAA